MPVDPKGPFASAAESAPGVSAAIAAMQSVVAHSFKGFSDHPDSDFYCAPGLSPEETWRRIHEGLARVVTLAAEAGRADHPLTIEFVQEVHVALFEPLFGVMSGFRSDPVEYPIYLGTEQAPVPRGRLGKAPAGIARGLRRTVEGFEAEVAELGRRDARGERLVVRDAVMPALRLYGRIVRIHPFADGNGRTAWVLFVYALMRVGLPLIDIKPTLKSRWALGTAIRVDGKQDYGPLADILIETLLASQATPGALP